MTPGWPAGLETRHHCCLRQTRNRPESEGSPPSQHLKREAIFSLSWPWNTKLKMIKKEKHCLLQEQKQLAEKEKKKLNIMYFPGKERTATYDEYLGEKSDLTRSSLWIPLPVSGSTEEKKSF